MKNPNKTNQFFSFISRRVLKRDKESVLQEQLLLVRSGFGFPLRIKTLLTLGFIPDYFLEGCRLHSLYVYY